MAQNTPFYPLDQQDSPKSSDSTGFEVSPDRELFCKLILSNVLAGSLIGKNGSTINTIRQKSGANIRISNVVNSFSPERIALISGNKESLAIAFDQVVELGSQPFGASETSGLANENGIQMKLLIPKSSVSILIGKGGQRINDIRQMSSSRIHISTQEDTKASQSERIVKVIGTDLQSVSSALLLVIIAIHGDSQVKEQHNFDNYNNFQTSPIGHQYNGMNQNKNFNGGFNPMNNMHQQVSPINYLRNNEIEPWMADKSCEIFMQVPDSFVGPLLGKNGQNITEIKMLSNAKIEISKKGDFVEGTNDRLVTINGSITSVHNAHARLMKKIMELQLQESEYN